MISTASIYLSSIYLWEKRSSEGIWNEEPLAEPVLAPALATQISLSSPYLSVNSVIFWRGSEEDFLKINSHSISIALNEFLQEISSATMKQHSLKFFNRIVVYISYK